MMPKWARCLKSPALRLFAQPFIHEQIKENIKPQRHWPLCGEFTGDRWIPHTKGQWRGKCFHLMTSSCVYDIYFGNWQSSSKAISWTWLNLYLYMKWHQEHTICIVDKLKELKSKTNASKNMAFCIEFRLPGTGTRSGLLVLMLSLGIRTRAHNHTKHLYSCSARVLSTLPIPGQELGGFYYYFYLGTRNILSQDWPIWFLCFCLLLYRIFHDVFSLIYVHLIDHNTLRQLHLLKDYLRYFYKIYTKTKIRFVCGSGAGLQQRNHQSIASLPFSAANFNTDR